MSAIVYYSGNLEAALDVAPRGKGIRYANAKYYAPGEVEYVRATKVGGKGLVPVHFDQVIITPHCAYADKIRKAYEAAGIEVVTAEPGGNGNRPPDLKRTPEDLGWTLKSAPSQYLKSYPKGASAEKAREILAELGAEE